MAAATSASLVGAQAAQATGAGDVEPTLRFKYQVGWQPVVVCRSSGSGQLVAVVCVYRACGHPCDPA